MSPTLYLSRTSGPCRSVLFVAKHLNITLNEVVLDMRNKQQLSPEYLKINPNHTIPSLVDNNVTVWESRAIIQYLCNKYAPDSDLYPKEPERRARVDLVLNFDCGSLAPAIRVALTSKAFSGVEPDQKKLEDLKKYLKVLDTLIGDNGYVAAKHVTIADLSLAANSTVFQFLDYDLSDYPNVKQWLQRLPKELPYYEELNNKALEAMKAKANLMKK